MAGKAANCSNSILHPDFPITQKNKFIPQQTCMLNNTAFKKKKIFHRAELLLTFLETIATALMGATSPWRPPSSSETDFSLLWSYFAAAGNLAACFSWSLVVHCCGSGVFGGKKHSPGTFPFWVSKRTEGLCNLLCSVSPFWNILLHLI